MSGRPRPIRIVSILALLVLGLLALAGVHAARAHQVRTGYVSLEADADSLRAAVTLDVADLAPVLRLDTNGDNETEAAEIQAALPRIRTYVERHLEVEAGGRPVRMPARAVGFSVDAGGHILLRMQCATTATAKGAALSVGLPLFDDFGADYKVLARITVDPDTHEDLLTSNTMRASLTGVSEAPPRAPKLGESFAAGARAFLLDPRVLLSLLALVLPLSRPRALPRLLVAYLAAHLIASAAASKLELRPGLLDAMASLALVYLGAENLFGAREGMRFPLAGALGLIAGLRFSDRVEAPRQSLLAQHALSYLGLVVSLLVVGLGLAALLAALTRSGRRAVVVRFLSGALALLGIAWFLQGSFGLRLGLP